MAAAAQDLIQWIQSTSNPKEEFCLGKHVPLEWREHDMYTVLARKGPVPAQGDYFHAVDFTHVVHGTHTPNRRLILPQDATQASFLGKGKSGYADVDQALYGLEMLWLSPVVPTSTCVGLRAHMKKLVTDAVWSDVPAHRKKVSKPHRLVKSDSRAENLQKIYWTIDEMSQYFVRSPAFKSDESSYGPHAFSVPLSDLIAAMAVHHEVNASDIEFRVLGTFKYQYEWMHVVGLCPKGRIDLQRFPLLPANSDVLRCPQDGGGSYEWRVRSSSTDSRRAVNNPKNLGIAGSSTTYSSRKWEHLTFACVLQPGKPLRVPKEHITHTKVNHNSSTVSQRQYVRECIPSARNLVLTDVWDRRTHQWIEKGMPKCPEKSCQPPPGPADFPQELAPPSAAETSDSKASEGGDENAETNIPHAQHRTGAAKRKAPVVDAEAESDNSDSENDDSNKRTKTTQLPSKQK